MSWLCQLVNEIQDRVLRIEQLLDFLDIRAGRTAKLVGGNWEVSNQQIAQWVAGTTLPLSDSSEYVRFKDGNLEIRGGAFSIHTGATGAHMTLDGTELKGYDSDEDLTVHFDWDAGTIWAKAGGFGGTSASPVIVLDNDTAEVFVPQPIYLGDDATGLIVGGQTASGVPYIQSANFSTGVTGWRIDNNGDAEFNSVVVRGTIYASGGEITGDLSIAAGGALTAANNNISMDPTGINIKIEENSYGTDIAWVDNPTDITNTHAKIFAYTTTPEDSALFFQSLGVGTGNYGFIVMEAVSAAGHSASFQLHSDDASSIHIKDANGTFIFQYDSNGDLFLRSKARGDGTAGTLELKAENSSYQYAQAFLNYANGFVLKRGGTQFFQADHNGIATTGSVLDSTAIGCRVYRNTTQSLPNDTWTTISYSHEVEDTDNCWSSDNPTRLIAQRAGTYIVSASIQISTTSRDQYRGYLGIVKNGHATDFEYQDLHLFSAVESILFMTITGVVVMAEDDYIEIKARQATGSSRNIVAATSSALSANSVSFYRIA